MTPKRPLRGDSGENEEQVAKAAVETGPVIEKVTRTRTIPPQDAETPDFWDYIDELNANFQSWENENHVVYLYRVEPAISRLTNDPSFIDKVFGKMEMPDGRAVDFSIEAIKEKFGGHVFRAILKRGSQRVAETRIVIEAPPKFAQPSNMTGSMPLPSANGNGNYSSGGQTSDVAQVANKAIDTVSGHEAAGVRLGMDMLRTASEVIAQRANPSGGSTDWKDEIFKVLIMRALEPPRVPDPIETFKTMKEIFQPPATNGLKDTLEFIGALKGSGLFAIGGRGSSGIFEIAGQVLPTLAQAAVQTMHEWRLGIEAQRGVAPVHRENPAPVEVLPPAQATAAPAVHEGKTATGSLEWILERVVQIMLDLSLTVDEQVDEVLAWLYRADPNIVTQILDPPKLDARLAPGEQGILQLFQYHEVLKRVPVNPRLSEFIKKFFLAATEEEQRRAQEVSQSRGASQPA